MLDDARSCKGGLHTTEDVYKVFRKLDVWLAVAAILNSVLSLAVYLRIVVPMYRAPAADGARRGARSAWTGAVVWVALFVTLGVGLGAQLVLARLSGG